MMTKAEAQAAYRQAWAQRCLAQTQDGQIAAERVMDAVQPFCVDSRGPGPGPGPEWVEFVESIPGYCEFWERWASERGVNL